MEQSDAFAGLECIDCGTVHEPDLAANRCDNCGGLLDPTYEYDELDLDRETIASWATDSLWQFDSVLPVRRETAVSMNEGMTPLVECEKLASELGVGRVLIKDEGRNPSGTSRDRELTLAVTAAIQRGASEVALPSTGTAGWAAAAYAGRAMADIEVSTYLPARAAFSAKAMVNVHDANMTIVGGRYPDAEAAFEAARTDSDWYSLAPFDTPYRHEGRKTAFYELMAQLEWSVPDVIVHPTGAGIGTIGTYKAARELHTLGLIDDLPALYAAQATGCSPIVDAVEAGKTNPDPVEYPDTICGDIEIPDPIAGSWIIEALSETGGGAVANDDNEILDAAIAVAKNEGIAMAPSSAVAASAAWDLAESGAFDGTETVILMNTVSGSTTADVLRSHLMGQGI